MFRADLHCHTLYSDGVLTPAGLLSKAKEIGLSGLSITDHDSIQAYETAIPCAREKQLLLGSGVEFSCAFKELSIHVLGYDFAIDNAGLKSFCEQHRMRRQERNRVILDKLKRLNIVLDEDELNRMGHMIGRPHIARLMMQKGYVSSMKEAFQRYIGDLKPCYFRGPGFSIEETLALIHEAHGKAFIAHPHLMHSASHIKTLLKLPFDGIECHYAKLPSGQEKKWIEMAKEKNLLISGGSDFHGDVGEYTSLGSSWVDEEHFHKIFQHLL